MWKASLTTMAWDAQSSAAYMTLLCRQSSSDPAGAAGSTRGTRGPKQYGDLMRSFEAQAE